MGYLTEEDLLAAGVIRFDRITEPFPRHRGHPTCAVCSKPVDEVRAYDNIAKGARGVLVIVAYCHGEKDVVEIPCEMIEALGDSFSLNGTAFASAKALPPPLPGLLEGEDGGTR